MTSEIIFKHHLLKHYQHFVTVAIYCSDITFILKNDEKLPTIWDIVLYEFVFIKDYKFFPSKGDAFEAMCISIVK